MDVQLIQKSALPFSRVAHELVGADHGGVGICVIFVDAAPGDGPSLHKHPYEEIFITLEALAIARGYGLGTAIFSGIPSNMDWVRRQAIGNFGLAEASSIGRRCLPSQVSC